MKAAVSPEAQPAPSPLHQSSVHESADLHVTGTARYVDDLPAPAGMLVARIVTAPRAPARVVRRDATTARAMPGVHAVLFADAIPGHNRIGPVVHDEPVLAEDLVEYVGQPVALVVGETYAAVRAAAAAVEVDYAAVEPAIRGIEDALRHQSFHGEPHIIARGDVSAGLGQADLVIEAEAHSGAQDHFYLETQAALAVPGEQDTWHVYSSTQHPTEAQFMVAEVLGVGAHQVVCSVPRMGGGFGGKESQASNFACLAALGAHATGRPVRVWLDREQDMTITGKRHPFFSRYRAGFDREGRLLALDVRIWSDGGFTRDLSGPVLDRALFHLDNAYFLPALRFEGRVCKTHLPSNTAFRGFGGPQGMVVVEDAMNRAAESLGLDPAEVRAINFYTEAPRDRAPYGQVVPVEGNRLPRIYSELLASSDYHRRRQEIAAFNTHAPFNRRGIGFQPVKFGISFTNSLLNQAGALVLVYKDGSVQVNHGGTEMGQGLHTKMRAVAAHELGVPVDRVRVMTTATDKVPNTSPTAASSGSDLNGQAVAEACRAVRGRMAEVAAEMLGCTPAAVLFSAGQVRAGTHGRALKFGELALNCWLRRVPLSACGFYATPGIRYDYAAGQGEPFFYFAYGGAVTEVAISTLTGEYRVLRADILHDVGNPLVPSIDVGQVEGGYIQGLGWLTTEEVLFRPDGRPITVGPSTYKIPAVGDAPVDFRVALLDRAEAPQVIHGSKAVGEPPLMLAISAVTALRHAIGSVAPGPVELALPATTEAVLRAIERQRQRGG